MNPFPSKQKLVINPKYNNKIKNENDNGMTDKNEDREENLFYITKSNGHNPEKLYKESIKSKMAKSSTSFYKH